MKLSDTLELTCLGTPSLLEKVIGESMYLTNFTRICFM